MPDPRQLLRVLRHRDFRLFWMANSATVLGDNIVAVALALFVIDLTGSATDLGLVLAAYSVPLVALLLVGGVLADRLPRNLVVVSTDLVRCVLHAALAVLILAGEVRIWQLMVIGVLFGAAEAFYRPAATGLLPQTVPEDEIQEANAVTTMSQNLAEFAGPALATVLVLGISPAAAFGIDAATFLVSAALMVRLRPRRRMTADDTVAAASAARHLTPPAQPAQAMWSDVRAGFAEVRSRAWVWATLAVFSIALVMALAPLVVVGPLVAREQYGDLAVFGYVFAAFGAGTLVGSLSALRWRPRYPMRTGMIIVLLWPAAIALFAAGPPLAVAMLGMALGGACVSLFEVWWLTALAERIPADKLSRVTSYDWMVSLGLVPLGFVLAGPAADAIGATEVLLGGAVIACVALALGLLPRETRMLERLA
jgi:MFS family permease